MKYMTDDIEFVLKNNLQSYWEDARSTSRKA